MGERFGYIDKSRSSTSRRKRRTKSQRFEKINFFCRYEVFLRKVEGGEEEEEEEEEEKREEGGMKLMSYVHVVRLSIEYNLRII